MTSRRLAALISVPLVLAGLAGCWRKDQSLAERAGAKVGETITEIGKGVGSGIERGLTVPVEVSPLLTARGVGATVSRREKADVSVYLTSREAMRVRVAVKALDASGREIGRAKADVEFEADDGQYVSLTFPAEMEPSLVTKYVVDETK